MVRGTWIAGSPVSIRSMLGRDRPGVSPPCTCVTSGNFLNVSALLSVKWEYWQAPPQCSVTFN